HGLRPHRRSRRRQDRGGRSDVGRARLGAPLGQGLLPRQTNPYPSPRGELRPPPMETRAPYTLIGLFVLVVAAAVFGFVYWLHNVGGLSERTAYRVQFENSVSGMLIGAA